MSVYRIVFDAKGAPALGKPNSPCLPGTQCYDAIVGQSGDAVYSVEVRPVAKTAAERVMELAKAAGIAPTTAAAPPPLPSAAPSAAPTDVFAKLKRMKPGETNSAAQKAVGKVPPPAPPAAAADPWSVKGAVQAPEKPSLLAKLLKRPTAVPTVPAATSAPKLANEAVEMVNNPMLRKTTSSKRRRRAYTAPAARRHTLRRRI